MPRVASGHREGDSLTKLIDAFGGISIALLALAGLALSLGATQASAAAAARSLERVNAVSSALQGLETRTLFQGGGETFHFGNVTCSIQRGPSSHPYLQWSFNAAPGVVEVSVTCAEP